MTPTDHEIEEEFSASRDGVTATSVRAAPSLPEGAADPVARNLDMVREFHRVFSVPVLACPTIPADRVSLRLTLIDEERSELGDALAAGDVVEVADALTDIAYLVYGTALEFGIDLDACFAEVHRSNMSKLGADGKPILREDGKVLKGPSYFRPDLGGVLAKSREAQATSPSAASAGNPATDHVDLSPTTAGSAEGVKLDRVRVATMAVWAKCPTTCAEGWERCQAAGKCIREGQPVSFLIPVAPVLALASPAPTQTGEG